jgi:hypothetical protein
MRILILLLIALFACPSQPKAQVADSGMIVPEGRLEWKDFTGEPDLQSGRWASTYTHVYYRYNVRSLRLDTAFIDLRSWPVLERRSWVIRDRESDELLTHEQGHYDLAIYLALKFRKQTDTMTFHLADFRSKIDSTFKSLHEAVTKMELLYDEETNHMLNREAQLRWNKKLDELLQSVR